MAHHHCRDFDRAAFLRGAAAEAGRGLPSVKPGTPLPAGTGLSRRSLLMRSAGMAMSIYGASALSPRAFEAGVAEAAAAAPNAPVLVSVFLEGGIDSMSVLAPTGDPLYRRLRPKLALPAGAGSPFSEDDRLRWHPAAASLAALHGEGKVSVFPSIGYDHADQSHFTSRHYWEVGQLNANAATGWLGRYLDRVGTGANPLQGLSLDGSLSPALATAQAPVAAIEGPGSYEFWGRGVWGDVEDWMHEAFADIGAAHASSPGALGEAGAVAARAGQLRRDLLPFRDDADGNKAYSSPVEYPADDDFPERLAGLAAMLAAGLPIRCVALSAGGDWDTHDNQEQDFADSLKVTADSLAAFQRDLEARGLADRVLTLVWSEFGRRAEENGSAGTDHGAGGTAFLIGTRARGRMVGEFPGLGRGLDADGNLRATSDFRGVYSGLLEQWFDTDAAAIIPGAAGFTRPELIR